jgi:hypothetical protein
MEDLVPLLIFIVIAVINVLKYQAEKKAKGKQPPAPSEEEQPHRPPSSLEEFFEEIAEKFEPKPAPQPEWPESIERPDYVQEMEEFERTQAAVYHEDKMAEITLPPPPPAPIAEVITGADSSPAPLPTGRQSTILRLPVQGSVFSSMSNMRISTPPLLRSAAGKTDFDIMNRRQLKRAILASLVFGTPRAYDTSFDNTIAK